MQNSNAKFSVRTRESPVHYQFEITYVFYNSTESILTAKNVATTVQDLQMHRHNFLCTKRAKN